MPNAFAMLLLDSGAIWRMIKRAAAGNHVVPRVCHGSSKRAKGGLHIFHENVA